MPITREKLRELHVADLLTDDQLDAVLATIDQDAVAETARARWSWEVWDRTSPVNDTPAEHFLGRDDVGDSAVYLLLRDGTVVFFQPHTPHVEGHQEMDDDTVEEHA